MKFKGRTRKKFTLKEKQEEILAQRVYLESIMSSMTDSLIVVNPDATLRLVNKAALDLLGYKEDELIGQPMKKIFLQEEGEEERGILHKYFQKIITAGAAYDIGLTFLTKQGRSIPVNFSGAAMRQDGKITGIVGVARDMRQIMAIIGDLEEKEIKFEEHSKSLTRMQRAMLHMMGDLDIAQKEALQASESKYRLLAENLPQKIFIKDINLVYIFCNKNYARDLKIEPEEIKGKTDYDFYPKELAEKYRADDKRIMESKEAEEIEEKYIREGVEKAVQTIKTPTKDKKGNVTGILGIFWDITERKKMEDQLLFAAKEWRTTFDSITDLVSIHDKDFKITRVNKAFADVFKMKPQEVIGKTCYALVHQTKEPPPSCPHMQVMRTKKPTSVEFFEPHLGMFLEITCSPVLDQ
jgi:PAS domain S-box-containing protein